MKVKELIEKLNEFDHDQNILFISEDEEIVPEGYLIRVLELLDVQKTQAVVSRDDDRVVSVKFGKDPHAMPYVCIDLTSNI